MMEKKQTTRSEVDAYIKQEDQKRLVWSLVTALIATIIFGLFIGILTFAGTYALILKQDKEEEERIAREYDIDENA